MNGAQTQQMNPQMRQQMNQQMMMQGGNMNNGQNFDFAQFAGVRPRECARRIMAIL